jgi:predicted secreted protein
MKLAMEVHRQLGTDLTQQIDVYGAVGRIGVPLAFVPLHDLSGAYVPATPETDDIPGIIVNSKHPRSRQRYSAAHELAHHLRDGVLALDVATDVLARSESLVKDQREAVAESFAAWFLMPRALVQSQMKQLRLGVDPTPEDVYRLSLALGTSYLATAAHLYTLKVISRGRLQELAKVPPKWIKNQVAVHGPGDSWGDVWLVRDAEGGRLRMTPRPGDEIVIELSENPSTGYVWRLEGEPAGLHVLESTFEAPADPRYGVSGARRVILRADQPGLMEFRLLKTRLWQSQATPAEVLTVSLAVENRVETDLPAIA